MVRRKADSKIQIMAEIGIMAAVGFILDAFAGVTFKGLFPNGGSINIAMIAVLIAAYRRGFLPALFVGLIMGAFDLMKGPYMIASDPWRVFGQLSLDYLLPYAMVSLAGLLRPMFRKADTQRSAVLWMISGIFIGGLAKFASHYLAGILFWADPSGFAWDLTWMNPFLYCFIYNIGFTGPSVVLSGLLVVLIFKKSPQLFLWSKTDNRLFPRLSRSDESTALAAGISALIAAASFLTFLILYLCSYQYEDYGEYGSEVSFNRAYLLLLVLSIAASVLFFAAFVNAKRAFRWWIYPVSVAVVGGTSVLASLSSILRAIPKGADGPGLWLWFGLSAAILVASLSYYCCAKQLPRSED